MKLNRNCNVKYAAYPVGCPLKTVSFRQYKACNSVLNCVRIGLSGAPFGCIYGINILTFMPPDPHKIQALRSSGTLNPHPDKVRHPRFAETEFFDPHDMVQVKYETLRAIQNDGQPIAQAAVDFGLSRPTIYQAQQSFQAAGLEGLFPQKRGPKGPHKLTPQVWQYLVQSLASHPELKAAELVRQVRQRFQVQVHPRTLEKALHKAKRGRPTPRPNQP